HRQRQLRDVLDLDRSPQHFLWRDGEYAGHPHPPEWDRLPDALVDDTENQLVQKLVEDAHQRRSKLDQLLLMRFRHFPGRSPLLALVIEDGHPEMDVPPLIDPPLQALLAHIQHVHPSRWV